MPHIKLRVLSTRAPFNLITPSLHVCASVMSDSATLWIVAHQAPLSMGFSRQEYWSGLPCPPPGDLQGDLRMEPASSVAPALQADSLALRHRGGPDPSLKDVL